MKVYTNVLLCLVLGCTIVQTDGATPLNGDHIVTGSLEIDGDAQGKVLTLGANPLNLTQEGFKLEVIEYNYITLLGPWLKNKAPSVYAKWTWETSNATPMTLKFDNDLYNTWVLEVPFLASSGGAYFAGDVWFEGTFSAMNVSLNGVQNDLYFTPNGDRKISIWAQSGLPARKLTIQGGGAAGTDQTGGTLVLSGGQSTGAAGSRLEFQTAPSGGSSGASVRNPVTRMTIDANGDTNILGRLKVGSGIAITGTNSAVVGSSSSAAGNFAMVVGEHSHALGDGSFVSGFQSSTGVNADHSAALGRDNSAAGYASFAAGWGNQAQYDGSVALGRYNIAGNSVATATGYNTRAGGAYSLTTGFETATTGGASSAFGWQTIADGNYQMVIGKWNEPQGFWNSSLETDALFIIGNGANATTGRSNAMIVRKDAAMGVGEKIVITNAAQTVVGKYNAHGNDTTTSPVSNRSDALFVVGNGTADGARKNALRVRADGTLLITPAGDIDMGDFTAGEKP